MRIVVSNSYDHDKKKYWLDIIREYPHQIILYTVGYDGFDEFGGFKEYSKFTDSVMDLVKSDFLGVVREAIDSLEFIAGSKGLYDNIECRDFNILAKLFPKNIKQHDNINIKYIHKLQRIIIGLEKYTLIWDARFTKDLSKIAHIFSLTNKCYSI